MQRSLKLQKCGRVLYELGIVRRMQGKLPEALECLKQCLELHSSSDSLCQNKVPL